MRCDAGAGRVRCCAVLCDRLCAALGMSRRSVGRSVDSLFWRAGVIRLFPSPFPPDAAGAASEGKTSQPVSVGCTVAAVGSSCRGERVGWRYSYAG